MQFRLSHLFTLTTIAGVLTLFASTIRAHWDMRSVYLGYYGPAGVPDWASGTGGDKLAEAFGGLARVGVEQAPWMILMALCCFGAAIGIYAKGGAR
ncbi:MAG: hypothetical protein KGL39_58895 [Patescibacteria group bacterium]|nr:hypothetical protein [Patescibacteria group bacterium]